MDFNTALVNYLFKEGLKNDSSSLEVKSLIKEMDVKLKDVNVYSSRNKENFSVQEYALETKLARTDYLLSLIEKRITVLDEEVRKRLVAFKLRLLESKDLVRQALLSERTLTGESYTMQIPLLKEYASDNTTATIDDNIVLGVGFDDSSVKNKINISTLNITSEEDTQFTITSKNDILKLDFEENLYRPYNQVKISVRDLAQTGILFLEFNKNEVISVLDKDGYEIIEPLTTDKLTLDISNETKGISIRFANNSRRQVVIKNIYFTEAIYNTTTVYETLPIAINKDLSFLTVQTCDNYSTKDISLKYEISINNSSYRAFRPNGKLNVEKIQSIIRTRDVDPTEVKLSFTDKEGSFYRYYNEDLVSKLSKLRCFTSKMGEDFYSIENFLPNTIEEYSFNFYCEEDMTLILSPSMFVYLDNVLVTYEELSEGLLEIKKGLHTFKVSKNFWKEIIDLDLYTMVSVDTNKIVYTEKEDNSQSLKEIENDFDTSSYTTNSIYLQMFLNNCRIYLEEEVIQRKYDKEYIEYMYKENGKPIYVYAEAYQTTVESIQIKVTLSSKDATICPYISRIIVRGV